MTNGAFGAYDADSYASAHEVGRTAADVLRGKSPSEVGIIESPLKFMYDFKQLVFFKGRSQAGRVAIGGTIINEPYMEKYRMLYILLYSSILALLVFLIVWLYRINRRESRRRIHAQTRLLIQHRLVAQRDEFDNDVLVPSATDCDHVRHGFAYPFCEPGFSGDAGICLQKMYSRLVRTKDRLPAGSILQIYNEWQRFSCQALLKQVVTG